MKYIIIMCFFMITIFGQYSFNVPNKNCLLPDGKNKMDVTVSWTFTGSLSNRDWRIQIWDMNDNILYNRSNYRSGSHTFRDLPMGEHTFQYIIAYQENNTFKPLFAPMMKKKIRVFSRTTVNYDFGPGQILVKEKHKTYQYFTTPHLHDWPFKGQVFYFKPDESDLENKRRIFDYWKGVPNGTNPVLEYSIPDHNRTLEIKTKAICSVQLNTNIFGPNVFINNDPGSGSRFIYLDKIEGDNLQISADYQYSSSDGIIYRFDKWSDGVSQNNRTITINAPTTMEAEYIGKADNTGLRLSCTSQSGEKVRLTWNHHPSNNVSKYRVYRKAKNGVRELVGETTGNSITDNFVTYDPSHIHSDLIMYTVNCYFVTHNTWSDDYYNESLWGFFMPELNKNNDDNSSEIPLEFKITSYPNPFNPVTNINFQLPEKTNVKISIFDVTGKKIEELVDSMYDAGSYTIPFNASKYASGIYFCRIITDFNVETKKLILTK